ncbi:hypothetical protein JCM3766R1_004329, partial [Sporobolomyces carnicolor]
LSPLYTYALYHPLRFLLRYLVLPLPSLVLFVVLALLQTIAFVVRSACVPLYAALTFVTYPVRAAFAVLDALLPVWVFLGAALFIGSCVGAVAGLLTGSTTREFLTRSVEFASWPLRVVGIVEPPSSNARRNPTMRRDSDHHDHHDHRAFGADGGATIETTTVPSTRRRTRTRTRGDEAGARIKRGSSFVKRRDGSTTTSSSSSSDEDQEGKKPDRASTSTRPSGQGGRPHGSRERSRLPSTTEEEEEDDDEDKGARPTSDRGKVQRHAESGWRKRKVQDVLLR